MSGFLTRGWQSSRVLAARACATQLDRASSTTLTAVPNCSHALLRGVTYIIEAHITGTATANGGAKAAIGGDGILAGTFTLSGTNRNGATTNACSTTTTLGNAVAASTAVLTDIILLGSITVTTPGRAYLQFAQNASHADTSSVYVGSYVKFTPID